MPGVYPHSVNDATEGRKLKLRWRPLDDDLIKYQSKLCQLIEDTEAILTGVENVKFPYYGTRGSGSGLAIHIVRDMFEIEAVEAREVVDESDKRADCDTAGCEGQSREGVSKS